MNSPRPGASNPDETGQPGGIPPAGATAPTRDEHAAPDPDPGDDRALVERAQGGDRAAFRALVEKYQRRVYALAFGMLHDREDALDVTQEAFIRVHRYLGEFKGSAGFYTWLYRIVVNLCIDARRRADTAGEAVGFEEQRHGEPTTAGNEGGGDPERGLERRQLQQAIGRALDGLSPNHRAVIILREVDGLSYEDMARVMKCSKGTIMSRLFHARRRMQQALKGWLGGRRDGGTDPGDEG